MNILILSCKTGQGHHSVAQAIAETLDNRGHRWQLIDALNFISERTAKIMSKGHSFIYCHCPKVFQAGYEAAEKHPKSMAEGSAAYWLFARGSEDLYEYCKEQNFDAVVCTHVFASLMLTDMKQTYGYEIKSYFVATDYTAYPGVEASEVDACFIPGEDLAEDYEGKNTVVTGIPVHQRFFQTMDGAQAKGKLGVDLQKKHILIMCGSMGCGPMEEIAQRIAAGMKETVTLSIVCGTNRKLYQRLTEHYRENPNVLVHGFVQNVHELMAAADICVTKPGGISTTEAMSVGIPMVLVDTVAGCENHNMRYFQQMGGAVFAKDPADIASYCLGLIKNEEKCKEMSEILLKNRKNGAVAICDYLQSHIRELSYSK